MSKFFLFFFSIILIIIIIKIVVPLIRLYLNVGLVVFLFSKMQEYNDFESLLVTVVKSEISDIIKEIDKKNIYKVLLKKKKEKLVEIYCELGRQKTSFN